MVFFSLGMYIPTCWTAGLYGNLSVCVFQRFIYLTGRVVHTYIWRETERQIFHPVFHTPKMPTTARARPCCNQELGHPFVSPTWIVGAQELGPLLAAFPGALTGSRTKAKQLSNMRYWHCNYLLNPLYHNVNPCLILLTTYISRKNISGPGAVA